MSTVQELLDPYSLRARLQPALLMLAPIVIAIFAVTPSAWDPIRSALVLVGAAGGALFVSQIARDRGKAIEPELYAAWGGKPSMAMLRHRDTRLSGVVKRRYHESLSAILRQPMPTAAQERLDPAAADAVYDAATAWLLAQSRDTSAYRLLFAENISYGFRRNLLGAKVIALITTIVAITIVATCLLLKWPIAPESQMSARIGLAGLIVYALAMIAIVRRSWVLRAAEAYAIRLLEVVDRISGARAGAA